MMASPRRRNPFSAPRGLVGWLAGSLMARLNRPTAEQMVRRLKLSGSEDVLEVGVGPGLGLELLHPGARRLCGVDPSPTMVRMASCRVPAAEVRETGVSSLPWGDASFDRICSMNSVMLWPDLRHDLRELVRVLRPAGRLVIAVRDHSIERKYGGMLRSEIDGVVDTLRSLALSVKLGHHQAVAYIEAVR
ncbi:MAG: class I SAM-dependent methyltransferase [Myxococcales bacterium FL481]|nr:MAG: class I SAM-dependent methyltransferase [Myxococcales bacterium FL481]